jgi:electron transfer flavoprotein beta subunit
VVVRRQTESGRERYRLRLPIVLTITNDDQNVPRSPKTKDVLLSGRQPITRWSLADVGLAPSEETYSQVKTLSLPERKSQCEFIQGESLDERIKQLAHRIAQSLPRR